MKGGSSTICSKAELLITGLAAEMLDFRSDETQAEGTTPFWKRLWILGWPLLVWTFLVGSLFWPFITAQQLIGYRDGFQFYWPMFKWADAVWASGEWPLWCPYDGLGRSHLAEGVSSLFYPGKLVFFARWFSFESRYGIYLALHVWLAGLGASWCAGRIGADRNGKLIAMLSYGLAGPVLFAANNVIYLVSAAWLPWGLGAIWNWRQPRQRWTAVVGVSMCAALMILGGDPQMAVNLLLIAGACWLGWSQSSGLTGSWWRRLVTVAAQWSLAVVATAGLALVQLLPTAEASRESERAAYVEPRSLIEWVSKSWREGELQPLDSIWAEPEVGTHAADVYEFSQPPWTIGELIWPGFSGRPYPIWTHWSSSLPGAGRMWQPSLYQGLLPLALGLSVLLRREVRWLVWIGACAGLAALGWYGPVWLANEIGLATGWWAPIEGVNRAVGGGYWLLANFLFRYPAKLMVLVSLVVALLAGWAWSRAEARQLQRILLSLAGLVVSVLLVSCFFPWERLGGWLAGDELFGPFDVFVFQGLFWLGGAQALVAALIGWVMLRGEFSRHRWLRRSLLVGFVLAIDLVLANSWLLPGLKADALKLSEDDASSSSWQLSWHTGTPRNEELPIIWVEDEIPKSWSEGSSANRLEEIAVGGRAAFWPRLHWVRGARALNGPSTIEPLGWREYVDALYLDSQRGTYRNGETYDASWIFFLGDPVPLNAESRYCQQNEFKLFAQDSEAQFTSRWLSGHNDSSGDFLRVDTLFLSNQKIGMRVKLDYPGTIFLAQAYAPGWRVDGKNLEDGSQVGGDCVPVAKWLRGFRLPAGSYALEFSYKPENLYVSIYLSLICWCGGGIYLLYWRCKH
jgi:hypothetical protein